ncbi:MAG: gfo/Idh/MocA family oxidoreductase, partial [Planctomycetes bacterium]|nr:gfo/Idh/MocA family oxidoreductase [Planctomycetota bacterium]
MANKSRSSKITRREVLGGAAALATITIVPSRVLGGKGKTAPSDKPNIGGVGIG